MSKKAPLRTTSPPTGTLRERADSMASATSGDIGRMDSKDIQTLVHELRLRQIELELRNEEMVNGLAQIVGTQAELRQFNEQLEIRVKDRSSELLKTQGTLRSTSSSAARSKRSFAVRPRPPWPCSTRRM